MKCARCGQLCMIATNAAAAALLAGKNDGNESNKIAASAVADDGSGNEAKREEVDIQMGGDSSFQFLGTITLPGSQQLSAAAENMGNNAAILRSVVQEYMNKWDKLHRHTHLGKMLVPGIKNALPVLKLVVSSAGGSALVEAASHLSQQIWGSVEELCDEVVVRSCTDVLMAVHSVWQDGSELMSKELVVDGFRQMHNALEVESYTTLMDESLRHYIAYKLRKPLQTLAESFVMVGEAMQMEMRLEEMDRSSRKVLMKLEDLERRLPMK